MSVDFSKITELSDSYGNITQITDASGRVLWSSAPKVVYLRPSADVAITASAYPVGTPAYACINDEVADGDSTYLYNASQKSTLVFSGIVPNKKIESVKFYEVIRTTESSSLSSLCRMRFNGTVYGAKSAAAITTMSYVEQVKTVVNTVYNETYGTYTEGDNPNAIVDDLNSYIEDNGSGLVEFEVDYTLVGGGKDGEARVTQLYIEIICE